MNNTEVMLYEIKTTLARMDESLENFADKCVLHDKMLLGNGRPGLKSQMAVLWWIASAAAVIGISVAGKLIYDVIKGA